MYMRPENIKHLRCIAQRTQDHHSPLSKTIFKSHHYFLLGDLHISETIKSTIYSVFSMIQYLDMHKTHKNLVLHSEMI